MTELGIHRVLIASLAAAVALSGLLLLRTRDAAEERARAAEERCEATWQRETHELREAHQRLAAKLEAVLAASSRRSGWNP